MRPNITLCLLYYDEPQPLSNHFEEMKLAISEGFQYIIVDDGSSKHPIEKFLSLIPKEVSVYKINENYRWNIPGARNLAALVSKTEWFVHLDCDLIFSKDALTRLKKLQINKKKFYSFGRNGLKANKPTAGTLLLNKSDFWATGGYNELFRGSYGYNDPYLKYRLKKMNVSEVYLSEIILEDKSETASSHLKRNGILKNKIKYYLLRNFYWKKLSFHFGFSWKKLR